MYSLLQGTVAFVRCWTLRGSIFHLVHLNADYFKPAILLAAQTECCTVLCIISVYPTLVTHAPSSPTGTQSETSGDWCSCAWQGDLCQFGSVVDSQLTWLECSLLSLQQAQPSCIPKEEASHQSRAFLFLIQGHDLDGGRKGNFSEYAYYYQEKNQTLVLSGYLWPPTDVVLILWLHVLTAFSVGRVFIMRVYLNYSARG